MSIVVFDPTRSDSASQKRGVGRYVSQLKESFPAWRFVGHDAIQADVFIHPFFNLIGSPDGNRPHPHAHKNIAVIHDTIPLKYPTHFPLGIRGRYAVWKNIRLARSYDLIVTDSEASKKDIVALLHIDERKIHVVYPYISISKDSEIYQNAPSQFFLYVGDVNWHKNIYHIADAVSTMGQSLVCVGTAFVHTPVTAHPWLREFALFDQAYRASPQIIRTGFIADAQLRWLYEHTVANLLLSHDEGFPAVRSRLAVQAQEQAHLFSQTSFITAWQQAITL